MTVVYLPYLVGEPLVGEHLPGVYDDGEPEHDVPHDLEGPHRADHLRHGVAVELLLLHRVRRHSTVSVAILARRFR